MNARTWIVAIAIAGALLRLGVNDVTSFSPADEATYTDFTQRLTTHGYFATYADITRTWVNDRDWWRYPSPMRFGYLALTSAAFALYGSADPRALAWLSTLAGILLVPFAYATARRLADDRTALLAAAFTAVSPLELALGRRALQDEVFCLAVLLAFLALVRMIDRPALATTATAVVALTFAIAVKETFLLLLPALLIFLLVEKQLSSRAMGVLVAAPLLWWAALAALARDLTAPFRMLKLVAGAMSARYVIQYQSGPPHRVLFDFVIVAPLVTVLACAAIVMLLLQTTPDRRMRATALFVVAALAVFSLLASKNLRFLVVLDPFLRILGAWVIASSARTSTLLAIGAANAFLELELFRTMFLIGGVYDPVTHTLLDTLGAVPRDAAGPPEAMVWPWACAGIGVIWWAARRLPAVSARGGSRRRPVPLATDGVAGAPR